MYFVVWPKLNNKTKIKQEIKIVKCLFVKNLQLTMKKMQSWPKCGMSFTLEWQNKKKAEEPIVPSSGDIEAADVINSMMNEFHSRSAPAASAGEIEIQQTKTKRLNCHSCGLLHGSLVTCAFKKSSIEGFEKKIMASLNDNPIANDATQ